MARIAEIVFYICAVLIFCSDFSTGVVVSDAEWNAYKAFYNKSYVNTATTEAYARYYYAYNKNLIETNNIYYTNGLRTYKLAVNQFTDILFANYIALFPLTTRLPQAYNVPLPPLPPAGGTEFDPANDIGYTLNVEDQGTVCNSGWAYSTAKAVELFRAYETGDMSPASLSAQNLIDCAGQSSGCTNQVPQSAFDFLSQRRQGLNLASAYPNDKNQTQQGMCILPPASTTTSTATLQSYAFINDGADETMRRFVPTNPVVIEFNPTSFEFMHYSEGIFQQPATYSGSHFMTVIGYGVNTATKQNFFIVQNSFGRTWGENGLIRIEYSTAKPLAKSAIMPVS